MSVNINKQDVLAFIQKKVGASLDANEAKDLKVKKEYNEIVDETGEEDIKIEEILDDSDLYAQFATMCADEKKADKTETEDKKKEKDTKVKDKNQAKA